MGDRRGRQRFEIVGQLWGTLETIEPLLVRNLGRGGALLETRRALAEDTVHEVRLALQNHPVEVQARVKHVTPISSPSGQERYLIGLQFVGLGAGAVEEIDHLVATSGGRLSLHG